MPAACTRGSLLATCCGFVAAGFLDLLQRFALSSFLQLPLKHHAHLSHTSQTTHNTHSDHLGPVFSVARHEFLTKLQSLKAARPTDPATTTLADVVAADTAAGVATAKGSATRCLHRLLSAILFVKILLGRLAASRAAPLREAASDAYEAALAPFHTYLIKTVVRGGLLTLPSREHFLSALGETEDSARPRCEEVAQSCSAVVVSVSRLLSGIDFPVSDGAPRGCCAGGGCCALCAASVMSVSRLLSGIDFLVSDSALTALACSTSSLGSVAPQPPALHAQSGPAPIPQTHTHTQTTHTYVHTVWFWPSSK